MNHWRGVLGATRSYSGRTRKLFFIHGQSQSDGFVIFGTVNTVTRAKRLHCIGVSLTFHSATNERPIPNFVEAELFHGEEIVCIVIKIAWLAENTQRRWKARVFNGSVVFSR